MEDTQTGLKVVESIWDQLTNAPSHILLLLVLLFVGMLIKKSPLPNWGIPWILITLGVVGYSLMASPGNIHPDFPSPKLVLGIYGGMIGVGSILAHWQLRRFVWFCKLERALMNAFREEDSNSYT